MATYLRTKSVQMCSQGGQKASEERPRATQERPKASRECPETTLGALQDTPECPKGAPERFGSELESILMLRMMILDVLGVHFEGFMYELSSQPALHKRHQ